METTQEDRFGHQPITQNTAGVQLRNLSNSSINNSIRNDTLRSPSTGRSGEFLFREHYKEISQEEKNKQLLMWYCLYHVIPIFIYLAIVIMHYLTKDKLKVSEVAYFGNIGKNWNLGPITHLEQCSDEEDNSNNLLSFEKWPGLNTGCKCSSGLLPGPCNKLNKRSRCLTQTEVDPIDFEFWKNTNLCPRRKKVNYLHLNITKKSTNCTEGKMPCGIVDSNENILCTNNQEICTVNNILNFKTSEEIKKDYNGFMVNLKSDGDENILFFSRDFIFDGKIPIEFRTSTELPCRNPYFVNMNYEIYMLNKFYNKQRCLNFSDSIADYRMEYSYDKNFYQIDEMNKKTFYQENKIEKILKKSAYNVEIDSELNRKIQLYTKNYFGLKYECHEKIKKEGEKKSQEIINSLLNLFEVKESIEAYSDQGWFYIIFFILGFIIMLCALIFPENRSFARNPNNKRWDMKIFYMIATFVVLCLGGYILLIQYNLKNLLSFESYLTGVFDSSECVGDYTIEVFNRVTLDVKTIKSYFMITEIMIYFIFLFHFIFIGCLFNKLNIE